MKLALPVYLLVLTFLLLNSAYPQLGTKKLDVDNRLKEQLQEAELNYTIDSDGDFKLHFTLSSNRTQVIWVRSATINYQSLEIREMFSPVWKGDTPPSEKLMTVFLIDNSMKKMGYWQMVSMKDSFMIFFCIKTDAEISPDILEDLCWFLAGAADDMEEKISEEDDF